MKMNQNRKDLPLLKWIKQNTRLSRRKALQTIVAGQVRIDGKVITDTGFVVTSSHTKIAVNNRTVRAKPMVPAYILLNKPKGAVTSTKDPAGRTTVLDLVKKVRVPVFPVGRLDIMTQGLLLLTNDGDLAHHLMHPRFSVPRTYHVKIKRRVPREVFSILRDGAMKLDGKRIRPVEVSTLKSLEKNTWLEVTIREGRSREVRRIFNRLKLQVLNLIRVRYGPLALKGLRPGQWRPLTEKEIRLLKQIERSGNHD